MKNKLIVILVVSAFLYGCSSTINRGANKNVAGIYMPGLNLMNPSYKVFHQNDSLTAIYFRLKSANILYTKKRDDTAFSANLLIRYELIDRATKKLADSSSIFFTHFRDNKKQQFLEGMIPLKTVANHFYDLEITVNDLTRDHYIKKTLPINRLDDHNNQNYLMLDANKKVAFKNHFNAHEKVIIRKNENNELKSISLKYYNNQLPIAKPPFSENNAVASSFKPQLVSQLNFDSTNHIEYTIQEKGLYHFQTSNQTKTGLTLFNFHKHFPKVKTPEDMIGPMRYISTKKEYELLLKSENKKLAVDNYWLKIAESSERARTLIRAFYTRVESANKYFTSYMEGWKTDRGIIYIIYGAPNVVYKNRDYENWIYGEENNMMSISFMFHKVNNPISTNDYSLSRSALFKSSWFRAVDGWRSGRIY